MVAGGLSSTGSALRSVEILELSDRSYRPLFDKWLMLPRLNIARAWYPSLGVLNNRLFIAGGRVSPDRSFVLLLLFSIQAFQRDSVDLATVENYGKSAWERMGSGNMIVGRSGGNSVTFNTNNMSTIFKNCLR